MQRKSNAISIICGKIFPEFGLYYTKVELIQAGYEELLARHDTDFAKLKDGYDDFFESELEQFKKK